MDLNLFTFDYDLTLAVFFLSAEEKVYARYGGRDASGPDARQSLAGLRYTMNSVLEEHQRKDKAFAPRPPGPPKTIRQVAGAGRRRGCFHCHQVKEVLDQDLKRTGKWDRALAWRYPLPDNLGLVLDVDRGNVVRRVAPDSPAAQAGLEQGDVVRQLNGVPVHSLADAQFGLDRAPRKGKLGVTWERAGKARTGSLSLPEGWRKSDIAWRPSMQRLLPSLPLDGNDLTTVEKQALGLSAEQLAFRQRDSVHSRARAAGVRGGDIILGVDDKTFPDMDAFGLDRYVHRAYLVGDRIQVNILRDGKRLRLPLTLR